MCVFSFLIALFVLASASTRRFGYSMLGFFSGSPSGSGWGCPLLSSRFVTLCSGPSLAPRLAGFTVPARPTRDKSQWENVISCGGGQVFLVRLGGASSAVRAVHIATVCSVKVGIVDLSLLLAPDAWARGCWLSVTKRSVLCPLGSVHFVLSLRVFFVKNLLSSW